MVDGDPAQAGAAGAATVAETGAAGADTKPGRAAERATRSPAAIAGDIETIRFDAIRSALYHGSRRAWYESCHRWLMFGVLMAGSGTILALIQESTGWTAALAVFSSAAGALDLVFDFGGKAAEHAQLTRQFYAVLAAAERCEDEGDARRCRAELIEIYGEERPQYRAVDAIAWNAAQLSLYGRDAKRLRVRGHESLFRNVWRFDGAEFPEVTTAEARSVR